MKFLYSATVAFLLAGCAPAPETILPETPVPAEGLRLLQSELNAARVGNGRAPLAFNARLQSAAQAHAADMARQGYFSHSSPDGTDLTDRLARVGYRYCFTAENIAKGQPSASQVMGAWMTSAGHRRNNLSRDAREFGAARAAGNIWVLVFGAPC